MNEKLKEAAQAEFDARYPIEWNNYTIARAWAMEAWHNALAAAARGEIPGFQLVPVEPTHAEIKAMAESVAVDDEGAFPSMGDLIGFSGENKTHTVLKAARAAMLTAYKEEQT